MFDIARSLDRKKFEPVVICAPEGGIPDQLAEQNIRTRTVGRGEYLRYSHSQPIGTIQDLIAVAREILRLAREENARVVHAFDGMLFFAACLAKLRRPDLKIVWLDCGFNLYPYYFRVVMWWCFRRADFVATLSRVRQSQHMEEGLPPAKSVVVPCGTDYHLTRRAEAAPEGAARKSDEVCVGIIGRIVPIKNFEMFLQVARMVADKHPRVRFRVIGRKGFLKSELEYYRRIREMAEGLGLADRVTFQDSVPDLAKAIGEFDLLASTSHLETFGRTLVETMAMSKPVVATAVGAMPEVIVDGEVGYLTPPGDVQTMAERICQLVENAELREAMGRNGYERVLKQYDIRLIAGRWEQMYEVMLEGVTELNFARRADGAGAGA
jgi:glycosyltransferase involved in cell wall biosynthesis